MALAAVWALGGSKRRTARSVAQRVLEPSDNVFHEFGRLAQELAHEIRNPLTAINARLYKLQKRLPETGPEHREAALIADEIKRLDQILESFRQWGGPAQPTLARVSANRLLSEVRDLFAAQLDPQCIDLRCDGSEEVYLQADRQLLKQVLINLVKNAAESTLEAHGPPGRDGGAPCPPRGLIVLRVQRRPALLHDHRTQAAVLEVEDNGSGVPTHVRTKLLQPFFSTKERGTGLGLPIAARIVAQHGGQLEFESKPGRGAVFRVLLPLNPTVQ